MRAFNIPIVAREGYEADDVIGTLAHQAAAEEFEVYMMTPDKDYAQLVSDRVYFYKPGRFGKPNRTLGVAEVLEDWGIQKVEQVIDMLGLQGDTSDNIPGVPGIGPKTARKLLQQYESIEAIYDNLDKVKSTRARNALEQNKKQALMSKRLATIEIEVPVQFDAAIFKYENRDDEELRELFRDLEFRSLTKRILGASESQQSAMQQVNRDLFGEAVEDKLANTLEASKAALTDQNIETVEHDYQLVEGGEARKELLDYLLKASVFCFDTETTGLNAADVDLVGISFSAEAHKAFYLPLPKKREEAKALLEELAPLFQNREILKVGQNLKFDLLMLRWYDVQVEGPFFDTMLAHYLLEPDKRHNMNYLSETYLGYSPIPIETLIGKKGKKQLNMGDVSPQKVMPYACEDADVTLQLYQKLKPLIEEDEDLSRLFRELEIPLIEVLVEMEYNGMRVDAAFLENYSQELTAQIEAIENKIAEKADGERINLDSPKQVGELLFDKLEIPYRWRKTKTGQYSTNESKLTELAEKHEVVADILQYRQLAKLRSTYVDALPKLIAKRSGRIHSSFTQALTVTGRLSSKNPNLQNIPIRTPQGREVRKAFVPRDEQHILLAADYSQVELRLIAAISGDEAMLEAFRKGEDIHSATAARIFGVPPEEVSKEQRYSAKTVNFSIIYGAGATNLSQNLDIKRAEAKELMDQYFEQYSGIKKYMEEVVDKARKQGYVTTLLGRRRYLRAINSRNGMQRSHDERNAINTPIQGSAADMIKLAMIKVYRELKAQKLQTKMILQVHDELVFDVPKQELETVLELIEREMRTAMPEVEVPIVVELGTGANWLEAH